MTETAQTAATSGAFGRRVSSRGATASSSTSGRIATGLAGAVLSWGLIFGVLTTPVSAQADFPVSVTLSADTVEVGTVFELIVAFALPPARLVHFPDTLAATVNLESTAPVESVAREGPAGVAQITLTYPMMAFGEGELPVPGFDLVIGPRGSGPVAVELPGGSAIGSWSDSRTYDASFSVIRVPRQGVWVTPVFSVRQIAEGIEPMPPNDVSGGSWSWPSLTLMLLCSSLLAATLVSTTKGWIEAAGGRAAGPAPTPEERRGQALAALDDLLAENLHADGHVLDFYTRSTAIVRRYIEAVDADWAPHLTSGELMQRLQVRSRGAAAQLGPEMLGAEVVKFGRLRPDAPAAELHWRTLRGWVETSVSRPW